MPETTSSSLPCSRKASRSGRETDARGTLEQTAKCLGFTYEALMQGAADGIAVGRVVAQVKREHPVFATRN